MEDYNKTLSVIVPIFNEEKYIEQCIESILSQDYPKNNLEIIFVDGMSIDNTRTIINSYMEKYSFIKLLDNSMKIVPCAMNIGIKNAIGEIIIRLDAHACFAINYFSTLVKYLRALNADNVGVVCKTDVLNKNSKTLAIREVLSNKFGVGNSIFRTGIDKIMKVDTVPFGCWKRETFDKYGYFDERLVRNQDFEYNRRITKHGGTIYIVPNSYCIYYSRESFSEIWKQNYNNGLWGIRTILYTKTYDSLAIRHYIPMLFVSSLIFPLLLGIFWVPFVFVSILSISIYILMICSISIYLSIKKQLSFIYLIISFFTLHFSNGFGMLTSFFTSYYYINQNKIQ